MSRWYWLGSALAVMGVLMACSSDDSGSSGPTCDSKTGKCVNDATRSQSEIDKCVANKKDAKCGKEYTAFEDCAHTKATCDSSGKTDQKKLVSADCKDEFTAFTNCTLGISSTDGGSSTSDAATSTDAKTGG